MLKRWIVTVVDTEETADGKARIIGVYLDKKTATDKIKKDMDGFIKCAGDMELDTNYNKMSIQSKDGKYGCEWNVEEVLIPEE